MRLLRTTGLLLCGLLVFGCGAATSQENETAARAASDWVTYHQGMPTLPDRSVFDAADQAARQSAADLVDRQDAHFAGTYVREADSVVVLVATDHRGVALAEERFADFGDAVAIERAEHSHQDINGLADRLREIVPGFAEDFRTWGASYTGTGLMVQVGAPPTEDQRAAIETFAQRHRLPMEVYVVEGDNSSTVD
ncbi:hypothetical protein FB382_002024 [Nocardioides ginsengisegetis]|uniref:Lipoprotein n=1 Tax=Nocardioides ginsengisegetis TaxID=661491 RepID=A0A7W3IZY9_9ACTN|nr:hypothetical protein [Nocardioides ginsengisegetis]MBA8803733.1 hypothetical protein [Nocardioides ginsengisegetis]